MTRPDSGGWSGEERGVLVDAEAERYGGLDQAEFDDDLDLWLDDIDPPSAPSRRGAAWLARLLGLTVAAGFGILVLANALSPTTLTDTTDTGELPDDAGTSASGRDSDVTGDPSAQSLRTADTLQVEAYAAAGSEGAETGAGSVEPAASDDLTATPGPGDSPADEGGSAGAGGGASGGAGAAVGAVGSSDYRSNLELIRGSSVRNRNHDDSPHRDTPSASLTLTDHYGPRSEYLNNPSGAPEQAFPVAAGGQFRAACEFSHFTYDDPLVFPGKPGASHLHMHFGNTDVNAFTTYETLINSGSSTCNGQELNRTGYWVPAMFDGNGNVRIPEDVVIYYKGEGLARGRSEVYPEGAAFIAEENLNTMPSSRGGIGGKKLTFLYTDNFSTNTNDGSQTMPACDGSRYGTGAPSRTILEVSVKFPQCWNGKDPADWRNFGPPQGDWYGSNCGGEFNRTLPNLEYFVNYLVEPGENTRDWYLSSDVDPTSFGASKGTGGATSHGDWWGGWHAEVNQMWIDNCVNFRASAPSGCGRGYLTDGGPNGSAPYDGPALKFRPQYTGPNKVPAQTLFEELCPAPKRSYSKPEDAAYCAFRTGY